MRIIEGSNHGQAARLLYNDSKSPGLKSEELYRGVKEFVISGLVRYEEFESLILMIAA
jgi:hypothetical protein